MRHRLVACILVSMAGCGAEPPPPRAAATEPAAPTVSRIDRYRAAKAKARAWLDVLEVDAVELDANGVKGKKKVGEILEAYMHFLNATDDAAERAAVVETVRQLARQTESPEYHDMATAPERKFKQDSMSYFRVLALMDRFGLDTAAYRAEVYAVQPRIDDHLADRDAWPLAMFRIYYKQYGLELPPLLAELPDATGVVAQRLPVEQISLRDTYRLTHQVYVAFEYGDGKTPAHLSPEDLSYLKTVMPGLLRQARIGGRPDLVALLVSCMTYLGLYNDVNYLPAIDDLLARQNPDGTWGDYERSREQLGDYVDQHQYLHTTTVVMRALLEAFEGDWSR